MALLDCGADRRDKSDVAVVPRQNSGAAQVTRNYDLSNVVAQQSRLQVQLGCRFVKCRRVA